MYKNGRSHMLDHKCLPYICASPTFIITTLPSSKLFFYIPCINNIVDLGDALRVPLAIGNASALGAGGWASPSITAALSVEGSASS